MGSFGLAHFGLKLADVQLELGEELSLTVA
jgi:hypothetical protein